MRKIFWLMLLVLFFIVPAFAQEEKFFDPSTTLRVNGERSRTIEIKAKKFSFTPNIIKVNKGDTIRIRLVSEDVHHGLFLDGYGVNTSAYPGQEGALKFVANKTGRFSFRCSHTCGEFHPYMIGYLYVSPNKLFPLGASALLVFALLSLAVSFRRKEPVSKFKLFGIIPLDWRLELTRFTIVRSLFKSRWFPFLPIVFNLFVFTIILLAGFVGGWSTGNYNFGVMIVWILWWVLLMMFMVPVVGRLWCMVCPFPLIGEWIQRGKLIGIGRQKSWGLNKKWPNKWKNLWPLVILFWISTWFSGFFTVRPLATFMLLGSIILLAVIISIIYEKRTFCITMCPVSGFMGLYSNFSLCAVRRKDPEICQKHLLKTCFVGNEKGYGCPWMELPYDMNRNTYCGLCLECFKACPFDNMGFFLRPFGQDLLAERKRTDDVYNRRGLDEAFKGLTMMGIFLSFFIAFQGPYGHLKDMARATTLKGYLTYLGESFLVDFIFIPVLFLLFTFLSKKASRNKEVKLKSVFVNFSNVLIPVGLAIWAGFSLGIILPNGSYLLHILSDPFAFGWNLFGTANFPWTPVFTGIMPYLQVLTLMIGFLFSLDFGYKMSLQTYKTLEESKWGWLPILVYLVFIHLFFLKLFCG